MLVQIRHGCVGATPWGDARFDEFYGASLTPTAYWDGLVECAGDRGSLAAQYQWYEAEFLARRAAPTDVTIDVTGHPVSGATCRVGARLCIEPDGSARTMRIHMVAVLDQWPEFPYYSRNTFRQAAPAADVTVGPGECVAVFQEFTFDAATWALPEQLRLIVWAQEPQDASPPADRAAVFQAVSQAWPLPPDCNANGIVDWQDIFVYGTSDDLNSNGVPDECEFAAAGADLWTTPGTGVSFHDFSGQPLPADFFGPGSDPFDGRVVLGGVPFFSLPPFGLGPADTVIARLADADVAVVPSQDTVPVRLAALNLYGTQPITVTSNGGQNPQQWDVRVCLSELPQPVGALTVYRDCQDGGRYDLHLPVWPKFTFTSRTSRAQVYRDYGLAGLPAIEFGVADARWVGLAEPGLNITSAAPGVLVDADCNGSWETVAPGTTAFAPGVWPLPCAALTPQGASLQRKRLVRLSAPHTVLGLLPAQAAGPDSDGDTLADDADNCPADYNPLQEDGDGDSTGDECDNCPLHFNPLQEDCDNDGQGDVCAIASGYSADCNSNGVPDACDVAGGTSPDENGNGVPDECEYCRGDCDCDDVINWRDIDYLVAALNSRSAWEAMFAPGAPVCSYGNCDVNGDWRVSWRDIDPFIAVMNTTCPLAH